MFGDGVSYVWASFINLDCSGSAAVGCVGAMTPTDRGAVVVFVSCSRVTGRDWSEDEARMCWWKAEVFAEEIIPAESRKKELGRKVEVWKFGSGLNFVTACAKTLIRVRLAACEHLACKPLTFCDCVCELPYGCYAFHECY